MDQPKPNRNLSEIGHLFLSGIRNRQTGSAPRPQRKPPAPLPPPQPSLNDEEFPRPELELPAAESDRIPPLTAVIAPHLNGSQIDRVRDYARHVAATGQRVGLLVTDEHEFRLECFDQEHPLDPQEPSPPQPMDDRVMRQTIEEMNWDIDRWLLLLPDLHHPAVRPILRQVHDWVLLCTSDHDGIVACYRTLKGLWDDHLPALSLVLLDAPDATQADHLFRKFASVCRQFLNCSVRHEWPFRPSPDIAAHPVLCCRKTETSFDPAVDPQWRIVRQLCEKTGKASSSPPPPADPILLDAPAAPAEPAPQPAVDVPPPVCAPVASFAPECALVIELPQSDSAQSAISLAVLRNTNGELAECPIHPPMCPQAYLAVARNRRLVLLAAAGKGLTDLHAITQAYRWLVENRNLIAMALPQFAIDLQQSPQLHLLIDHADPSPRLLQPLLESQNVSLQIYRKVRWGDKVGLLLDSD